MSVVALAFPYSLSRQMGVWHFHFKDFCLFVFINRLSKL
jgi:hypothetical protein